MSNVTASQVIAIAENEVGYLGKALPTDDLEIKNAPNGVGKYTKYARDMFEGGYYNGNKNGYDFCTTGLDWCFYVAEGRPARDTVDNETCLNPTNENGAGAPYNAGCYDAWGLLDQSPKVGDKVYYCERKADGSCGDAYHCGLVVGVDNNAITTIEFNTSYGDYADGVVAKKVRTVSDTMRFGHPRYAEEPTDVEKLKEEKLQLMQTLAEYSTKLAAAEEAKAEAEVRAEKAENAYNALAGALKTIAEVLK